MLNRQTASHQEWPEWSTASEVWEPEDSQILQSTINGAKFIFQLVKNLCFWLPSHWYGRLGRNIGGVLSTPETSNKVSQAAACNKQSAENNSAGGENCDKQRCVFRANDRTSTKILLKFNWKFSQQWKAAIRSSYILRNKKGKEKSNFWNNFQEIILNEFS